MTINENLIAKAKALGCKRCGESNPVVLQFHHRDRATKVRDICVLKNRATTDQLIEELLKCDVLCANCHLIVEHEFRRIGETEYDWQDETMREMIESLPEMIATPTPRKTREHCVETLFLLTEQERHLLRTRMKLLIRREDDCWIWIGATTHGYPAFNVRGRLTRATHVLCALEKDFVPGRTSQMSCSNILCVNPDHVVNRGSGTFIRSQFKS